MQREAVGMLNSWDAKSVTRVLLWRSDCGSKVGLKASSERQSVIDKRR